jgi:hypothetical protein
MFLDVLFLSDGHNSLFWTHLGQLFDWLEALLIRTTSASRLSPFYRIFMLLSVRRDMTLFVKKTPRGQWTVTCWLSRKVDTVAKSKKLILCCRLLSSQAPSTPFWLCLTGPAMAIVITIVADHPDFHEAMWCCQQLPSCRCGERTPSRKQVML